jgi:hypothetical protein
MVVPAVQRRKRRPSLTNVFKTSLLVWVFIILLWMREWSSLSLFPASQPNQGIELRQGVSSAVLTPGHVKGLTPDQVFMGIKTHPGNYHTRVQSILDTYWTLAPRSIFFFTDSKSKPEVDSTGRKQHSWPLRTMEDPPLENPSRGNFNLVDSRCGGTHGTLALKCKTAAEIHYNSHHMMESTPWFCQFHDDTFVNLPNLLNYLDEFDADSELLYIGRRVNYKTQQKEGNRLPLRLSLAPGAAWCLSRAMVRRGCFHYENLTSIRGFSDDLSIAYIVQHILNVTMVDEPRMHTHLDGQFFRSQSDMQQQLTYGFGANLPQRKKFVGTSYPGVSFIGDKGGPPEDPMGFRSLFCNLWPDKCLA